jgi:hypothetical protein
VEDSRFWLPDIRNRDHANRAGSYVRMWSCIVYIFSECIKKVYSPFHLSMLLTNETIDAWFSGHIQNHIIIHQFILHAARHTKGRLDPNRIHQRLLLFLLLILLPQIALRLFHPQNQGCLLHCYPLGCHRTIQAAD